MWKEYSIGYLKKNKAASILIAISAFIAALFLSLISTIFYNIWTDNISRIIAEEGDWHGKLVGTFSEQEIKVIENFANVRDIVVNEEDAEEPSVVLHFIHPSNTYEDLPKLAKLIGMDIESNPFLVQYHSNLLAEYFIFSGEEKEKPSQLLVFYIMITIAACISLILIIHNAFRTSMDARIHQLGIMQSVGATPRQIRTVLVQEAFILCTAPIILGIGSGVGISFFLMQCANRITVSIGNEKAVFGYHGFIFLLSFLISMITVWISSFIPARKMSKISPLEAIKAGTELCARRNYPFYAFLFGIEGELARKSMYARRRAFRMASLSLTISFLVVSVFLNFMTISNINTKHTYFERYQDQWDLLVSVKGKGLLDENLLEEIREIEGVETCSAYKKAMAYAFLPSAVQSKELQAIGGFLKLMDVNMGEKQYRIKVPIFALDEKSFLDFCRQSNLDAAVSLKEGAVAVNKIWDSIHSNYKNKEYIPFVNEKENLNLKLYWDEAMLEEASNIKIISFVQKSPALKEELVNYSFTQIMHTEYYESILLPSNREEAVTYYNICASSDEKIQQIQKTVEKKIKEKYEYEIENRIQEGIFDANLRKGYNLFVIGICAILACIGIANVFANTLGFIYQRKREFARYISIGMTPKGIRKLLGIEAMIIGMKPILLSVPITLLFVGYALKSTYIGVDEFVKEMPVIPLFLFACFILSCVFLAYYLGGKRVYKENTVGALKNDMIY